MTTPEYSSVAIIAGAIELLTQKRTVTPCEIHEFCHNLLEACDIEREDIIAIEAELTKWLKELGVGIEE